MDNTIQQESILKRIINTLSVLSGTIILLFLATAAPLSPTKPIYNYLLDKYDSMDIIYAASNILHGISFVLFAVMIYVTWRLFAKKNFIAWLGATIFMAVVVTYLTFLSFLIKP